jgi:DNA mismatch endonuclease (patch repair protein)
VRATHGIRRLVPDSCFGHPCLQAVWKLSRGPGDRRGRPCNGTFHQGRIRDAEEARQESCLTLVDSLTPEQRSAQMSRIRGSNNKFELLVRRGLHKEGLRFRLGGANLPGRPDLVFPKFKTALFVNGCFWHAHSCSLFRIPKSNAKFWKTKLEGNRDRDERVAQQLQMLGWRCLVFWE